MADTGTGGVGVTFEKAGAATIARFEGERIAPEFLDLLNERLLQDKDAPSGRRFVLDMSRVTFLGSVGLTVIVVFLKRLMECGGQLALAGLNRQCLEVLRVMRFTEIIPVYPDVPMAVAAMNSRLAPAR